MIEPRGAVGNDLHEPTHRDQLGELGVLLAQLDELAEQGDQFCAVANRLQIGLLFWKEFSGDILVNVVASKPDPVFLPTLVAVRSVAVPVSRVNQDESARTYSRGLVARLVQKEQDGAC